MHGNAFGAGELGKDFSEAAVFLTRIVFLDDTLQAIALGFEGGETGAGGADFSGEDHGSIFLHWRLSASSRWSDSAGPQEPAA